VQETALEQIRILQRRGYSLNSIDSYLKRFTGLADSEFNSLFDDAVERNQAYYDYVISKSDILNESFDNSMMSTEIEAIRRQTNGELQNLTRSLGFSIKQNGKTTFLSVADAYQKTLDDATMKVWSGSTSYNQAIQEAKNTLTASGIKVVTYQSGNKVHTDLADVAARRAVMTGIVQMSGQYSNALMEQTDTPYMEITAHQGARDIDRPGIPWANHKRWQGKVYSIRSGDIYPNVYSVCGLGYVDGLEGANCRHLHHPYFLGVSERTYTDVELENIDPPPFKYQGKEYTAYQATQKMRQIERNIRALKRKRDGYDKGTDEYKALNVRVKTLFKEYNNFSTVSGVTKQISRTYI
jgi:hypothetical protein